MAQRVGINLLQDTVYTQQWDTNKDNERGLVNTGDDNVTYQELSTITIHNAVASAAD